MKSDVVFQSIFVIICFLAVPLFISVRNGAHRRGQIETGNGLPFLDFWRSCAVAGILICLRIVFLRVFAPFSRRLVEKNSNSKEVCHLKATRCSICIFKTLYFLFVSIYAATILHSASYFPFEFGGSSSSGFAAYLDAEANRKKLPGGASLSTPQGEGSDLPLRWYFFLNAGYHLSSAYFLFTEVALVAIDFWEACVQIAVALSLIFFGYGAHHLHMGAVLMFSHDICDVLASFCKGLVDTPYKKTTFGVAMVMVVLWIYCRLFCFAEMLLLPIMTELDRTRGGREGDAEWMSFTSLLLTLFLMNFYWISLMVKSCWFYLRSGKVKDCQLPDEDLPSTTPGGKGTGSRRGDSGVIELNSDVCDIGLSSSTAVRNRHNK